MDLTPEVVDLGVRLAESAAKNTAAIVADKIRSLHAAGKKDDTIAELEQIVSSLIADKSEITRIAQAYQSELVSQRITAGDVKYIADTVVPLLEKLAESTGGVQGAAFLRSLDALKHLLSVETVNVLQILGFDFRRAVGEPLTKLVEHGILARVDRSDALKLEDIKREQLFMQIALDADAFARFNALVGR